MNSSKVLTYSSLVGINLLYACVTIFTKYASQHEFMSTAYCIGLAGAIGVMGAYAIMACSLVLNIFCMSRGVQVKEVSVIESLGYLFVPTLAFFIFREKITWRKAGAITIIISGVILFFL